MPDETLAGLLVVDKPRGITSRDAVDRAQRWFPRKARLGHTGTLDPLATGVLVLCLGSATRLTEYVQRMLKTYRTTIHLGVTSDTDDAEGTLTPRTVDQPPTREAVEACLHGFLGEIEQVPPAFSAAKVSGERAYDLARSGEAVSLQPRRVFVESIALLDFTYPLLELEVNCGKGTYIRSLARDVGERPGCGGHVEVLRRTRVGPFRVEDAVSLDADRETARGKLLPVSLALAELPRLTLPAATARRLRQGVAVPSGEAMRAEEMAAFADDGRLIGVVRVDERGLLRPVKVIG